MTILELADACELADGADRGLDAEIAAVLRIGTDHKWAYNFRLWIGRPDGRVCLDHRGPSFMAPAYTASIDAAIMLVPEGWVVASLSIWPASPEHADNKSAPQSNCELFGTSVSRMARKMIWGHGGADGKTSGNANTAPLAICAAALRARHAMENENG